MSVETPQIPPRVVRIRRRAGEIVVGCDVYIGRAVHMGGWNLSTGKWASPYALSDFGKARQDLRDIQRINVMYEAYVRSTPELMSSLPELAGKTLGCWCSPAPCHGDVLVKLFREQQLSSS